MGTNNSSQIAGIAQSKIQLNLNDRRMTWLHGAGIAGLYITLKQLEKQFPNSSQRPGQLDWALSTCSISLNWCGHDRDALDWLLKQSFQINHEGLISLAGLNGQSLSLDTQIAIHQGITRTFLQHNSFYKSNGQKWLNLKIDGKAIAVQYKALTSYAHQGFARHLCDHQGRLLQHPLQIAGWLYPGAVMSHALFSQKTKFEVAPEEALVLLFAPIACWYFMLPSNQHDRQTQVALVIPEIYDLAVYAECDKKIRSSSYENFWVARLGDAGLKFLSLQEEVGSASSHEVRQCQAVLFGKTKWAPQQGVRTAVEIIKATKETTFCYRLSCKFFPNNIIYENSRKAYVVVSRVHGRIADNLAKGLVWWSHFAQENDISAAFRATDFEKEALLSMIEKTLWNDPAQKLFIKACHEALRRIYAKLYDPSLQDKYTRFEHRNTRIRSELGRCKNAIALRKFLSHFFAEAGQIPTLQNHWEELLPITTGEVDWQLTRDLFLLALASYKKGEASKHETKPEDSTSSQVE